MHLLQAYFILFRVIASSNIHCIALKEHRTFCIKKYILKHNLSSEHVYVVRFIFSLSKLPAPSACTAKRKTTSTIVQVVCIQHYHHLQANLAT